MKIVRQETSFVKIFVLAFSILTLSAIVGYFAVSRWLFSQYQNHFLPGVRVDQVELSPLTFSEAHLQLEQLPLPSTFSAELTSPSFSLASSSAELGLRREYEENLLAAFQQGKSTHWTGALVSYVKFRLSPIYQQGYTSPLVFNDEKLETFVKTFAAQVDQDVAFPSAEKQGNQIVIFPGKTGQVVDQLKTLNKLKQELTPTSPKVVAEIVTTGDELTPEEQVAAQTRAQQLLGKSLTFTIDKQRFTLTDSELIPLLGFPLGFHEEHVRNQLIQWETQVKRPGQNAEFSYDPVTFKVQTFVPHRDGWTLDSTLAQSQLLNALTQLEHNETVAEISLPLMTEPPDMTLAKTNQIGIKERIGFGESYYDHSIPSRIHNVSRAAEIINNTLVAPGEEFSFNKTLGDVSQATGFKPAYIIQAGRTVLGDGGGVCQVSTTLFRALLDSGLEVTKRRQHSYRVSYYELDRQPGFDAAVFSGETDLRFVNDSPGYVLLHFVTDPEKKYMFVEIYGTSDGRTTEVTGYEKWGASGPPAPVYQDDPTLPAGKLIQVDWAVGGIKAKFTHITRDKDGNIIRQKEYTSNYIPWSAKYRRGTGV